jgi:hypothetical protein
MRFFERRSNLCSGKIPFSRMREKVAAKRPDEGKPRLHHGRLQVAAIVARILS